MSKQWSREERGAAQQKVFNNPLWKEPVFATVAIDLQCELTEAVGIIEQYRHMVRSILGRKPVTNVSELEAQADSFLARNGEKK